MSLDPDKAAGHAHLPEDHPGRRRDAAASSSRESSTTSCAASIFRRPRAATTPSRSSSPPTPAAPFPASTSRPSRQRSTCRSRSTRATRPFPIAPSPADTPGPGRGQAHTGHSRPRPKCPPIWSPSWWATSNAPAASRTAWPCAFAPRPTKFELTPFALDVAKFALHYYDNYFGIHYPLKKLDFIGIPDFEAGAMENFGAITFRETDLLLDPKTASFRAQRNATLAIVHEMAHQWFGDLVTMQWWDNIWLNEGFATWMENKCTGAMHPEWNIPQFVAADEQRTLNIDAQPTTRAIRASADTPDEIEQMFDSIAYNKAGAVLLMVENYLGEETFRKGVHAYLAAHEYGNATAEDFWNAQTEVSHKPVDKIMESMVAAAGRAHSGIWRSRRRPGLRRAVALLSQPRHHARSRSRNGRCRSASKRARTSRTARSLLPPRRRWRCRPRKSSSPTRAAKATTAARMRPHQYAALVAHVETGLTPEERISLTGDEWAQVRADKATVGDYLNLVAALSSDASADVLSSAVDNVSVIADTRGLDQSRSATRLPHGFGGLLPLCMRRLGNASASDTPNQREPARVSLRRPRRRRQRCRICWPRRASIADQYLADPASVDPTSRPDRSRHRRGGRRRGALRQAAKNLRNLERSRDAGQSRCASLVTFTNPDLLERAPRILSLFEGAQPGFSHQFNHRDAHSGKPRRKPGSSSRRIGTRCRRNSRPRWARTLWQARATSAPRRRATT